MLDELFDFYCKLLKADYLWNLAKSETTRSQKRWMWVYYSVSITLLVLSLICLSIKQFPFLNFAFISLIIIFTIIFTSFYEKHFSSAIKLRRKVLKEKIITKLGIIGIGTNDYNVASEKVSRLAQEYEDRAKKSKFVFSNNFSVIFTFIATLFGGLINYITKDNYFNSLYNGLRSFAIILCFLVVIYILFFVVIPTFFDQILNRKQQKMLQFSDLLKNISLELYLFGDTKSIQDKILSK